MTEQAAGRAEGLGRRLILGAGATALVTTALRGGPAEAKPRDPGTGVLAGTRAADPAPARARSTPSALQNGYVYRSVSWADFSPESGTVTRAWGGNGVYAAGGDATLWATIDIPAGAVVMEIEWYASNAGGGIVDLLGRRWRPGEANHASSVVDGVLATAAAGIRTQKVLVPVQNQNAFAPGTKLALGFASTSSLTQVAGARVGFVGGGAVTMRETPYRAYNSKDPDKSILTAGTTRLVTIPGFAAPAGTVALIVNLAAFGGSSAGYLRVYADGAPVPTTSSINFTASGSAIANGLLVGVSAARRLKVYASATTHVVIDVLGTVS